MRLFNKVAIIGIGLIGGSLAEAIKKLKLAETVIGVSRHRQTIIEAKKNKTIDYGSLETAAVKDADLVIFATPPETIKSLAPEVARSVKRECIVTDVASVKKEIVNHLEKLFPNYLGAHPLTGSEKRGIGNARAEIFKNSLCILTPTKRTNRGARRKIERFWLKIGSKIIIMPPEEHDKILSSISHLPHLAAFSLINAVPLKFLKFAAGGFKDTTRIAASDAQIWAEIFLGNRDNLLGSIALYEKSLARIKSAIKTRNKKTLVKILRKAKRKRDRILRNNDIR